MFHRSLIKLRADGTYIHSFPAHIMETISIMAGQLDAVLDEDLPELRRLHPTAYSQDAEKDAGYQILARDQLTDGRRAAIDTVQGTADQDQLTDEEINCWIRVINDLRLVLGTRLDVSEDDENSLLRDLDPEATEAEQAEFELRQMYDVLGSVQWEMVEAMMKGLPDS